MMRLNAIVFLLMIAAAAPAQQLRYFQFTTNCGHGAWQDTAFVAATSDTVLIDSVLADLARPLAQRKFISGNIAAGNGGHNRNGSHWFKWHFVENEWALVENAIEVCDGCPYSDVDADTSYWLTILGYFCPWSGQPLREIDAPTGMHDAEKMEVNWAMDVHGQLWLHFGSSVPVTVQLFDVNGKLMMERNHYYSGTPLSLAHLPKGLYVAQVYYKGFVITKKITTL
ncbi:MAG: T9SS type A sorting domain-containing protein [Chitinophagales bacterium]|nr:T9SS type A sorting domain-containing protein [Chitinophagales bacterium]